MAKATQRSRQRTLTEQIEWSLLFPDEPDEGLDGNPSCSFRWTLTFRGRAVGHLELDLRDMFDRAVASGDGSDAARAVADIVSLLGDDYRFASLDDWLERLYGNHAFVNSAPEQLRAAIAAGPSALQLPAVQQYLALSAMKPTEVQAIVKAIAQGLRARAVYRSLRAKGGRSKVVVPRDRMRGAQEFADDVQRAARKAKRAKSITGKRTAVHEVVAKFLPDVIDSAERNKLAEEYWPLPPAEIAKRITARRFQIAQRRLHRRI